MPKRNLLAIAAAGAVLLGACGKHVTQVDPVYQKEVDDWKAGRLGRLTGPDGWTTLVGLYWLEDGGNRFGSGADNDMSLAAKGFPAHVGRFE